MNRWRRLLLAGTAAAAAAALAASLLWHGAAGSLSTALSARATRALAAGGMTPLAGRPARMAPAPPLGAAGPVDVQLTPSGHGWMVLNAAPHQVVDATADDGATWTDVGPPGTSRRGGLAWSWDGPSTAWVLARPRGPMPDTSVYRTTTAGRTWDAPSVLPGPPASGSVAPLAGDGAARAGVLLASGLWTSGNGGTTWRRAAGLPAGVGRAGLSWSPAGPWLSGEVAGGAARLWSRAPGTAGGVAGAWRAVDLPVPAGMRGLRLVTLPPVWSGPRRAGAAVVAVAGAHQWLWWAATTDGGRRWRVELPPVPVEGALTGGVQDTAGGRAVYALDPVAGGTAVWRGDPRAGTWSEVGWPLPVTGAIAVDFPDPGDGWVVAGGRAGGRASQLWLTANGGLTWQRQAVPGPGDGRRAAAW